MLANEAVGEAKAASMLVRPLAEPIPSSEHCVRFSGNVVALGVPAQTAHRCRAPSAPWCPGGETWTRQWRMDNASMIDRSSTAVVFVFETRREFQLPVVMAPAISRKVGLCMQIMKVVVLYS